jgi:hypothetical protein
VTNNSAPSYIYTGGLMAELMARQAAGAGRSPKVSDVTDFSD